jgi:hypothetical protein
MHIKNVYTTMKKLQEELDCVLFEYHVCPSLTRTVLVYYIYHNIIIFLLSVFIIATIFIGGERERVC